MERKLDELARRVERIEELIEEAGVAEAAEALRLVKALISRYAQLVEIIGAVREATEHPAVRRSDMSRHIVDILGRLGPMNISQLTAQLRRERGTASRRIVAKKLRELEEAGLVERLEGGKARGKVYKLRRSTQPDA
ncbi:MAG: hypothetical protein DRN96_09740 [Thermoproteota archaeon]|nr:MAG: hypothetical protein DRN96_09740 [Candidatus Korarchaeota archaeon]